MYIYIYMCSSALQSIVVQVLKQLVANLWIRISVCHAMENLSCNGLNLQWIEFVYY